MEMSRMVSDTPNEQFPLPSSRFDERILLGCTKRATARGVIPLMETYIRSCRKESRFHMRKPIWILSDKRRFD